MQPPELLGAPNGTAFVADAHMISIITPSFNQIEWLRLAVASVADQEGVEYEHIIQDGGTDGIKEIVQSEFGNLGKRLQVFVEKDAGMYDAVNRGLRRASGEICAYLNCDEQYLPGTLARSPLSRRSTRD